ncbi:MAG: hypothetical protein ABUL50_12420 [Rhizobacter sp.]
MTSIRLAVRNALLAGAVLALAPLVAHAQDDDKKMRPVCKMSDSDVHLTADGWAGPKCITADAGGQPVAASLAAEKARLAKVNKDARPAEPAKPLCKMGMPGVTTTAKGWEGPNCQTADGSGNPVR